MAHGGVRDGAGRKVRKETELRRSFASGILDDGLEIKLWRQALTSEDARIALDALKAITDHKYGRATQRIAGDESAAPLSIEVVHVAKETDGE